MKLGMQIDYAGGFKASAQRVADYERAGLDVAWVAEAYGFDGPSFMGYLAATTESVTIAAGILPIYTRTPTLMAMTAAGLDALSDGRFLLGLGASGPQVIEGFHGVRYDAPLGRTREMIDICRAVWRRERVTYEGKHYTLPLPADQGTGLGKPLKIIAKPVRERIPIWIASLGPKNVQMTAEKADGWLPIFFVPERVNDVWGDDLAAGKAVREEGLAPLEIAAGGVVAIGEDAGPVAEMTRPMVALYVGGMGAKGRNFYNDLMCRYGYEAEAAEIQDLYLDGKKDEAAAKVPDEFLRLTNLCGPESFVKERLAAFRDAGVTVLNIIPVGDRPLEIIEKVKEWTA
ncbi:LLM class F420-dependent oxidoreductase [Rhabdothermincola salaria]|uniref:LLM class F420-dependent oxidoreductase n=1 Tax=Rhabdothermincola salaria TaxID=2903142 RepID=UPI001E2D07DF|nr:LLM class F420-dependent oxidoreductase [Rhabdothermincola salaria]MCD9623551.1 LLM class F420-dependent oxidoreductase [Rhabdothermincola salaria]